MAQLAFGTPAEQKKVPTGCSSIDKALAGGLDYGSVACISGETSAGARELAQALMVSHLLASPTATVTYIDAAFAHDVRKLHTALVQAVSLRGDPPENALKALDRVQIMKVFNFEGLTESLAEVREMLEGKVPGPSKPGPPNPQGQAAIPPQSTINDSQAESEEDEMLDDAPSGLPHHAPLQTSPPSPPVQPSHLLIIDTLTHLTAPQLKNNYVQAQALLHAFIRSLKHLTTRHRICTLVLNDVLANAKSGRDESSSAFASCVAQPALGKGFAFMLDVHLLVHRVGKGAIAVKQKGGEKDEVAVVEVLHDRYGTRVGKWAGFTVDDGGLLMAVT
ncbi:hypothetical protein BDY17DRAFT_323114 [Neohortaea acidophila]|uniref:Uncharacterized protein n=1 Tax=Neohortaea acidophila TaxID=245834 RepID=A0A6A6PWW4_9PEZI|nr:uncharacterized protein BDY17DRAFT_323114 [Neohortaea acidophila]KAF2484246.1 hypothetical protein BDY17DRAFT_323114 [Neohortaea acidophila]